MTAAELAVRRGARYRRVTNALEFRVLGPLQVASDGASLPLGGAKQRAVLALLLLQANEVVPLDRLIDELWAGSPPESAANIVHGYVSHLRKALEPGRRRGEHELLVSRPPGYLLRVGAEQYDAERFTRLAAEGRRLLDEGEAASAAERLRAALALWRGPPLADLAYESFARPAAERLQELRLVALEDRIDADLALGRHGSLAGELRALVAEHPLRERLRGQLMAALYGSGQQAEALEVYREGRRLLGDELGIEPGPALRELERAILQQDEALGGPTTPQLRSAGRRRRRWLVLVAAAAVAAAAAAVGTTRGGSGGARAVVVYPHSVAVIDTAKNRVVDDIVVGDYPIPLAADGEFVYVGNNGDATVSRIIPGTRKVYDTGSLSRATDLVVRDGHLWAADGGVPGHTSVPPGTVLDFDLASAASRTIRVGPSRDGSEQQTMLALGRSALWVGNEDSQTVREVDPSFDRVMRTIHGIAPGGLAVSADGTLWVSDPSRNLVAKVAGGSGPIVRRVHIPGRPTRLATDDRSVWVIASAGRAVWRIDARTMKPEASIAIPITPKRILVGDGAVWVSGYRWSNHVDASKGGMVIRIDPSAGRIAAEIPLGDLAPDGMVFSHGLLWVAVPPSG